MSTVINAGLVTRWWPRRLRHPGLVELAVCQRLRALAAQVPADEAIVELGAYQGRATGWLLLGASEGQGAHVTTVDPWTLYKPRQDTPEELSVLYGRAETYAVFKQHMDAIGATPDRLTVKRGYAHTIGRKWVVARWGCCGMTRSTARMRWPGIWRRGCRTCLRVRW